MFTFSFQLPSVIALILIQSLPCAQKGPDTTDFRVWELSVKVIQESFSKPVRVKEAASHFAQTQDVRMDLKASERREQLL